MAILSQQIYSIIITHNSSFVKDLMRNFLSVYTGVSQRRKFLDPNMGLMQSYGTGVVAL